MKRGAVLAFAVAASGCASIVGADFDSLKHRDDASASGSGGVSNGGNAGASLAGNSGGPSAGNSGGPTAGNSGASGSNASGAGGGNVGGSSAGGSIAGNGGGNAGTASGGGGSAGASGSGGVATGGAPPTLVCGDTSGLQANAPWPMARYCPTRQGRSPAPRLAQPTEKWMVPTPSDVTTEPAIAADGTIYVGTQDGHLVAIQSGGTMAWSTALGMGPIASSPTITSDGTIVIGSGLDVYGVKPDGSIAWDFPTQGVIQASATVQPDGTIVIPSWDYSLYALTPDGKKKWHFDAKNVISSSPAVAIDGTIYFGSYDKTLYAVNPDGTMKWTFTAGDMIESTPAVMDDGTIVFGSYDKSVYGLTPDGKMAWRFPTGQVVRRSAVSYGTVAYVFSEDQTLYAIGPGAVQIWKAYLGSPLGAPAVTFDGAIIGAEASITSPIVLALDSAGNQLWKVPVNTSFVSSPPGAALAADGTIVVGYGSSVYAFGP